MGCDGNTPNVICPNRINPIVQPWLAALPTPTSGGALNNFQAPPIPDTILGDSDYYMWRLDWQGGNNHVFASFWHQRAPVKLFSQLPQQIATETLSDPQNSWVNRMNFDRTLTPTLLNHMSMGYLNRNEGYGCVNGGFVDDFPKIAGVANHSVPPQIGMTTSSTQMGCNAGVNVGNITTRPTFIINDAVTWVKGAHTLKVGMEWRKIMGNIHANGNEAGTFNFEPRRHRPRGPGLGQPGGQLPAGGGRQREHVVSLGVQLVPAAARVDLSRRRQLAGQQQADARLRPALGLLLASVREIRPHVVLRSDGCQPWRRRPARPARLRGR